jgi:hypothetical protein
MESAYFWLDFTEVLQLITGSLSHEWPVELLPVEEERTEAFWMTACREEMRTRHTLSAKIQALLAGPERQPMTPLEEWLLRRRVDWALQLGMAKFEEDILPPVSLQEVLEWALVKTWESDGCQGMWLHAERGGEQHPEALGWLRERQ